MPDATVKWVVVENNWPRMRAQMLDKADAAVVKAALDIEAQAKMRAPVLTGFLRGSIQASRVGPRHWRVDVGADYGIYQEYGTVHSNPHPFFEPAVNAVWPTFQEAMRSLF